MHLCLVRLHLHNQTSEQPSDTVNQFGFEVPTCCGAIPLDNTWSSDWVVQICLCMYVFILNCI